MPNTDVTEETLEHRDSAPTTAPVPTEVVSVGIPAHITLLATSAGLLTAAAKLSVLASEHSDKNPAAASALAALSTHALLGAVATSSVPIDHIMEKIPSPNIRRSISTACAMATGAAITFMPPAETASMALALGGRRINNKYGF